ncbi:hypothetical protein [Actinocrispum wychmicini]|nr:hypothetical protein [Actinocrispum wychmicini]
MGPMQERNGRTTPRVLNPLWIISLFLGISETTVGIAATQVTGWIQGLFAVSATAFPLLVSGAFFATLWKKPEVLYAPGDFPEHVPVPEFVHGIHRSVSSSLDEVSSVVRDTLESILPAILAPRVPPDAVQDVVGEAVASAQASLESRAIKIDIPRVGASAERVEWIIDQNMTVSNLLDSLWLTHLRELVKPYTYPKQWVLMDRQTGKMFEKVAQLSLNDDDRLLEEIGIVPGMELAVVLKGAPSGQNRKSRPSVDPGMKASQQ